MLTNEQAKENLKKYGPNELEEGKKKSVFQIFLEQFKDCLLYTSMWRKKKSRVQPPSMYYVRLEDARTQTDSLQKMRHRR